MVQPPPRKQRSNLAWRWVAVALILHVVVYFVADLTLKLILAGLLTAVWVLAAITAQSIMGRVVLWIPVILLASWWLFVIIPPWLEASRPIETDFEANSPQAASCVGFFDGTNDVGGVDGVESGLIDCAKDESFDELEIETQADGYCFGYGVGWIVVTHGTQGDYSETAKIWDSCKTAWTSHPSDYEQEITERAKVLLEEGAAEFVSVHTDVDSVVEEHGDLSSP